jgi:4-amino-4-deoxy-L-arabinose transferase-like glycosyltransferase
MIYDTTIGANVAIRKCIQLTLREGIRKIDPAQPLPPRWTTKHRGVGLTPGRRTLLALFSIAFGLRVLYMAVASPAPGVAASPATYEYKVAQKILHDTSWIRKPFTPLAPGYPVLLAVALRVAGPGPWTVAMLGALLGSMTVLVVFQIGEKTLGRFVGLAAALWLALSVHQMHFAKVAVRDVTVTFFLVLLCFFLTKPFERMRTSLWTGIVYVILVHIDPQFLLFFPFIVLYLLLSATRHKLLNFQYALLFASAVVVMSIPWTARNYVVYGEPIPIGLETREYTRPMEGSTVQDATEDVPRERAGFWENTVEFWRVMRISGPEKAWSFRHNAVNLLTYGLLLPFAIVGVVVSLTRRARSGLVLASTVVGYFLIRAVHGASERSRIPVEPLLILLAFYGVTYLVTRWRRREPVGSA